MTHGLLFNHTENWDVTFMEGEHSMAYFRDFPASNIRLIVLDVYYDVEHQKTWLQERLAEALAQGLHVITATHEPSAPITNPLDVTFQTLMDCGPGGVMPYEELIAAFIEQGGIHICNLAGHNHADYFGYTDRGVLNIAVECGTSWPGWCDSKRVRGTRTYDCFNVMGINVDEGILKLIRVGDNADYFLRMKRALCYDYICRKVIFNG